MKTSELIGGGLEMKGKYIFRYPSVFITLPEYTARAGTIVEIVRPLGPDEADDSPDMEKMYKIRAADGWEGDAFESELEELL